MEQVKICKCQHLHSKLFVVLASVWFNCSLSSKWSHFPLNIVLFLVTCLELSSCCLKIMKNWPC